MLITASLVPLTLSVVPTVHAATYSIDSAYTGTWTLKQTGSTGVAAMQIAVVDNDQIIVLDRVENNPLQIQGHPAWGAIYTISNASVRPIAMQSNSFCAGGSWLSNGTLANIGGDPRSSSSSKGGVNAIRLFTPCGSGACGIYDDPAQLHLNSPRWYPSTARLPDGSLFILGGTKYAQFIDNPYVIRLLFSIYSLFPLVHERDDGRLLSHGIFPMF